MCVVLQQQNLKHVCKEKNCRCNQFTDWKRPTWSYVKRQPNYVFKVLVFHQIESYGLTRGSLGQYRILSNLQGESQIWNVPPSVAYTPGRGSNRV